MTPEFARASYRRELTKHGEPILLRRLVPNGSPIEASALGKVKGYKPDELVGGVNQGDMQVLLLAEDLESASFPVPPKSGDKVVWQGLTLNVQFRPTQRRVGTVTVAYDLVVR